MLTRGQNFQQIPINIAGSSVFGRYPKISDEHTFNMFLSDNFLVPYPGYAVGVPASYFTGGGFGRAVHTSTKLNCLIVVIGAYVYKVTIFFDQSTEMSYDFSVTVLNSNLPLNLNTPVFITENNYPQVVISDSHNIYYYTPSLASPTFRIAGNATYTPGTDPVPPLSFTPGYIDFHDTYILCAASNDTFVGSLTNPANNTWRLGIVDSATGQLVFADDSQSVGELQTKPDNTQAVLRFPSAGNMIYVMGKIVAEPWFDVGAQLFPYQRSNSINVDYGCLNPDTIARMDDVVVWLAQNETSGPIIAFSEGGNINKITTDGIDYLLAQLTNPADSGAWMIRQDGHLIYHINFYTDNISLFYDFNTKKFFNACDENGNVFLIDEVAFYNNQYYGISFSTGNLYAFDTIYTTYAGAEIPRLRICSNIRLPTQEYFVANDVGFTIEAGSTAFQQQDGGDILLITQDGYNIATQGSAVFFVTQDNLYIVTQDDQNIVSQQGDATDFDLLEGQNRLVLYTTPRVDLSISTDGGETFGSDMPYVMNAPGRRKNKMQWWQLGIANDMVCQFKFWGMGRFVATDGILNIRQ